MPATAKRRRARPMSPSLCRCARFRTMKQALITGGARGIGFGIAEAMLAAGYSVTVTGLTADEAATVPMRENLEAVTLDVTCDGDVAACIGKLSQLDVLG